MQTITFIVSLPQYVNMEEDYLGKVRLMEILNLLYDIPIDKKDFEKAARQRSLINQKVETNPELKKILPHLEAIYGGRIGKKEGAGACRDFPPRWKKSSGRQTIKILEKPKFETV